MLALFTIVTVAMTWPLAKGLRSQTADVGVNDPLFYARLLRHFLAWLSGAHPRLFDADYFWPHPNVLATTDASFGILYCALPFLPFTRDLLTLVNLGILLTFVLTGHATYLLARELTRNRGAALVAGMAFAFCLFRLHQLDHLNVLQMQWMGYALYALLRLREKPSWKSVAFAALALWLHGSAGTNDALYSAFLFFAVGLWLITSTPREARLKVTAHLAAAVGIACVFLWPVYGPYLEMRAAHSITWPEWHVDVYGGRLEQFFSAPPYNKLYGPEHAKDLGRESYTFLGWSVLLLALTAAVGLRFSVAIRAAKPSRRVVAAIVVLTLLGAALVVPALRDRRLALLLVVPLIGWELARGLRKRAFDREASFGLLLIGVGLFYVFAGLGPHIQERGQVVAEGLWRWIAHLPGFGSVRTPARFWFVVSFAAALLAGYGVAQLSRLLKWKAARVALVALAVVAVLVEMRVAPLPLRQLWRVEQAPPVYTWIAKQPGKGAVLELPFYDPLERYRMYQTTLFDRPLVGGEAGFRPPLSEWMKHESFQDGSALRKLRILKGSGIEYVLLYGNLLGGATQGYRSVIEGAGGTYLTNIGGVDVFRFPDVNPRPFTSDNVTTTVAQSEPLKAGEPLKVSVSFLTRSDDPVFEYKTRKLKLQVESGGRSESVPVYVSPPLTVPGEPDVHVLEVPWEGQGAQASFKVTDEQGKVWAEGSLSVH